MLARRSCRFRVIVPGRTYRADHDATHSPMFHQVEGLVLDRDITLGHLKGCLIDFLRAFFGISALPVRFRSSYFPFTEPSMEVDIGWNRNTGELGGGGDWLEILGSGMVHAKVLANCGIDPARVAGFRLRHGHRARHHAEARHPRPAPVLRKRHPLAAPLRLQPAGPRHAARGGVSHEIHPVLARRRTSKPPPRSPRSPTPSPASAWNWRAWRTAAPRSPPSASPTSSRRCSTPTPTACASARSTPATGARLRRLRRAERAHRHEGACSPPPGSFIPGTGITLKVGEIRGVQSAGMLLSAREMGLGDDHDRHHRAARRRAGRHALPALGRPRRPGDRHQRHPQPRRRALAVRGVARDLAAAGLGTLKPLGPRKSAAPRSPARCAGRSTTPRPAPGCSAAPSAASATAQPPMARTTGCSRSGCGRSTPWSTSPISSPSTSAGRCTCSTPTKSPAAC